MKKILMIVLVLMFIGTVFAQNDEGFGYIPIGKKAFDSLLSIAPRFTPNENLVYPPTFTINTPPPQDQLTMGSCTCWAAEYCMYSYFYQRFKKNIIWFPGKEFSPGFAYHFCKLNLDCKNAGSNFPLVLNLLENDGCCMLDKWPYKDNDCNQLPSVDQLAQAKMYVTPKSETDWFAIGTNTVKVWKEGMFYYKLPIMVGFQVTQSFLNMWYHGKGIWTENNGPTGTYHAVCIVGYDDNKGMFKCQNSWGTQNGDNGYFWVSYDLVSNNCFQEAYFWRGY